MLRLCFLLTFSLLLTASLEAGFRGGPSHGGGVNRGNMSRPSMPNRSSVPNMSRPAQMPNRQPNFNQHASLPNRQPNFNQHASLPNRQPNFNQHASLPNRQPNFNQPNFNAPSGLKPNVNPGSRLPSNLPNVNPGNRLPSNLPNVNPGNRLPNQGNQMPVGWDKNSQHRPSVPSVGWDTNSQHRPGRNPQMPVGWDKNSQHNPAPGIPVGWDKNSQHRPGLTPDNRPNILPDNRPNILPDYRPNVLPDNRLNHLRPNVNRPIVNTGDINIGNRNNVINNRPSWVNIDRNRVNNINNNWRGQINNISNWDTRYPKRNDYWNKWGYNVQNNWGHYHDHHDWFDHNWWNNHPYPHGGWNYRQNVDVDVDVDVNRWWGGASYAALSSWFTWQTPPPATAWQQPVYYDYGAGGNVTYQDNSVYVNNQPVATQEEYTQALWDQATVAPPASEEEAQAAEWQPLGTFALSTDEKDVDPSIVLQLAVNKAGVISGTVFNQETQKTQALQGSVDPQTQRVALRVGESQNLLLETGLYNLTKDFAPAVIHYGSDKKITCMLMRLQNTDTNTNPQ